MPPSIIRSKDSYCLLSDLSYKEIAEISNIAGGLVCEYAGVVSINKDELLEEVNKLLTQ